MNSGGRLVALRERRKRLLYELLDVSRELDWWEHEHTRGSLPKSGTFSREIYDFFRSNGPAQIRDVRRYFSHVAPDTIRGTLGSLQNAHLVFTAPGPGSTLLWAAHIID